LSSAAGLQKPGIEYLREVATGALPPPPIAELLGMSLVEVERGRAVFALEPAEWMYNPIGSVHGGVAAALLDLRMGCAVHRCSNRASDARPAISRSAISAR
jgi:acyl-coenzyme A thioesterase PaaI-like protein